MKDTAGNEIQTINPNCDCGLTSGCEKCNPMLKTTKVEQVIDTEKTTLFQWLLTRDNKIEIMVNNGLYQRKDEFLHLLKQVKDWAYFNIKNIDTITNIKK